MGAPAPKKKKWSLFGFLWQTATTLLAPIGRILGRLTQKISDFYWNSIPLSPEIQAAMAVVEQEGFIQSQSDPSKVIAETLQWFLANRRKILAFTELIFSATHEAERFLAKNGREKKAYARELVLAVLEEMGFPTKAGLMGAIVASAVNGMIETAVHLFNKKGAFQHQ